MRIGMKPVDAIALATKNEEEAIDMYAQLSAICTDKEQKDLVESLAWMEQGHKVRLEEMYTNMVFPGVWLAALQG